MSDTMTRPGYVVRSKTLVDLDGGKALYWSNELGWTTRSSADVFTDDEVRQYSVPMGGEWEKV